MHIFLYISLNDAWFTQSCNEYTQRMANNAMQCKQEAKLLLG